MSSKSRTEAATACEPEKISDWQGVTKVSGGHDPLLRTPKTGGHGGHEGGHDPRDPHGRSSVKGVTREPHPVGVVLVTPESDPLGTSGRGHELRDPLVGRINPSPAPIGKILLNGWMR